MYCICVCTQQCTRYNNGLITVVDVWKPKVGGRNSDLATLKPGWF